MTIFSWGSNSHGQLGQNSEAEQTLLPVPIVTNIQASYITGGGKHAVILTPVGEIFTCGDNDKGQLGKQLTVKHTKIFSHVNCPFRIVKVSCGWDFTLSLTENSEVLGWGSNSFGQLGLSTKTLYLDHPEKIFDKKAVAIGAGLRHSVIVCSDGFVFTSGFGRKGQLGYCNNSKIQLTVDRFVQVQSISNIQEISCGEWHCIAISKDKNIFSWGDNRYGQLGLDPKVTSSSCTPINICCGINISENCSLYSGWAHNLILTDKGEVISWGRNDFGQLGEDRKYNWEPTTIKHLKNIKQICTGSHHSIALTEKGEVYTWGWNEHGNCGDGSCENIKKPYTFQKIIGVELVGSGSAHSFFQVIFTKS